MVHSFHTQPTHLRVCFKTSRLLRIPNLMQVLDKRLPWLCCTRESLYKFTTGNYFFPKYFRSGWLKVETQKAWQGSVDCTCDPWKACIALLPFL